MTTAFARPLLTVLCALLLVSCSASPASPAPNEFDYQPLWPFASQAAADEASASQRVDPGATALAFTRDFLGFNEIDRVTAVTEEAEEAWIGVGYLLPNDRPATAATIHLARFGAAADAPWEVVGTRDELLTLETPAYGSVATPVIEAGGRITGIDESLRLQVRQSTRAEVLGEYCCLPAGGQDQPWSVPVDITGPIQPGTLTLVVSTGGHVAEVERFAVTGLRVQ